MERIRRLAHLLMTRPVRYIPFGDNPNWDIFLSGEDRVFGLALLIAHQASLFASLDGGRKNRSGTRNACSGAQALFREQWRFAPSSVRQQKDYRGLWGLGRSNVRRKRSRHRKVRPREA
jgi:hypothetical protein